MKLSLPDVTLVMLETREHALARMALEDCLARANFGDVLVFTNKPYYEGFVAWQSCITLLPIEDAHSKLEWCRQMWLDVPGHVRTSHMLLIQWDSWVVHPKAWRPEFLQYDFIGSPWWYKDGRNVGNSGFALKSTRLARYLRDNALEFPCVSDAEDDLLCRVYRPKLEERGFKWAPMGLAREFAFECVPVIHPTFGFHGMFNWPKVLPAVELQKRLALAARSPYIGGADSRFIKAFVEGNRDLAPELTAILTGIGDTNGSGRGIPSETVT